LRYTLRQLEYFVAAGESGSITLASERAHISQASISAAITHLEREFGAQLFVRQHAQGLSLTPAGRAMLREAKQLLKQAAGLYGATSDEGRVRGTLAVGCLVTLAPMIMPELCYSFMRACPGTEIRQRDDHQEGLLERLRHAEIDVALTYDLQLHSDVAFSALASLPPHALCGAADPMHRQPRVALEELAERPMILLDLPISREYFLGLFHAHGVKPQIFWRSPHQEVVRTMVANGYGYALFNARPRADVALDGRRLYRVALAGEHAPAVLGMATLRQLRPSRLVEAFMRHCAERIGGAHIPGMVSEAELRRPRKG
jgi:DNA-binding transcriptional LysR family regulator